MYKILPIYNGNEIINYCVGKGDRDYVLETLAFTDNLASLRRLDLKTLYNKTTALMYWYEYTYKVGKSYNAFFTLQEQMGFIRFLEKKEVENRKRSIYLTGKNNKQIGLAYGTVSRYIGYINEYYVFLYNFHYINLSTDMLPFRKSLNIRPAKLNRIRLPEILTVDEVNTLLNACDTYRDKALIALMVSTGLRLGEVCALKMEALDFKNQSVRLYLRYLDLDAGVLKTGERAVKGNRKAFMALQYYFLNERSHVAKCDSVFVSMGKSKSNTGQPLKAGSIQSLFRKLRLKTNINHFHAHILRHTFATNFLSLCRDDGSKVGITMLKNLMGHKNLSTTMKYLHLRYLVDDADIGKPFEEYMDKILDI